MNTIPRETKDFINLLREEYKDEMELESEYVGTPEYWKKAGVIELIRKFDFLKENLELREIKL